MIDLVDFDAVRTDELVRMWRESFEFGVGVAHLYPFESQLEYFTMTVVPNHTIRIALRDDELVGFVAATKNSISQLYVHKANLGCGIGSRLLAWAKAQSAGSLWLFTFARNARARAFYEKHDFKVVALGFEPTWKLEDVKYQWTAQNAA